MTTHKHLLKEVRARCHLESRAIKLLRHNDSVKDMEWSDLIQYNNITSDDKAEGKDAKLFMCAHLHLLHEVSKDVYMKKCMNDSNTTNRLVVTLKSTDENGKKFLTTKTIKFETNDHIFYDTSTFQKIDENELIPAWSDIEYLIEMK